VLATLVKGGRDYLTELRAELSAEEMTDDVRLRRAGDDSPYREQMTVDGRRTEPGGVGVNPDWGRANPESGRANPVRRHWEVGAIVAAVVVGAVVLGARRGRL